MRRRGGPTSKVPEPTMPKVPSTYTKIILPVLYPMQMRLSSHVLSLSLFPLLLWIVALINKDRKCLDQIRYYYGLISTKYRTVAVLEDDKFSTNSHTYGTIANGQLLLCACILFLSFEGTQPCLRNTSFFLFFSNSLLQSALFCIFLSRSPLWKISKWVGETCWHPHCRLQASVG